ncbi:MAG: insulinase family protein [Nitrospirae bacterium]|nr:insulinase family protein [Nitrospirota bacterium]
MKNFLRTLILLSLLVPTLVPTASWALDVRREVLDNGLTLLYSNRSNLPVVKVTVLIRASKMNETDQKAGLANITAAMLTEGTRSRTSEQISGEIEFMGASLDAGIEADYTIVALSVLQKDVDKGFEILSDVILNPAFAESELKHKKALIKGSLKQSEEDPGYVAQKTFIRDLYGDFPYGRLNEGNSVTIDAIKKEDLVKFHDDYYLPSSSIISIVGSISYDEALNLIKKYMSEWKNVQTGTAQSLPSLKHRTKRHAALIDMDITQANVILGNYGISRGDPDFYPLSVMNYILGGGGFSSRMDMIIRDKMGLAYDVHTHFASYKHAGDFTAVIQTKNEMANTAIREMLKQIKKMKQDKVTDQELQGAKDFLIGSFPRRIDTMDKISNFMAQVEFLGLGLDYEQKYKDYINAVTTQDVHRVANKYLDDVNYQLVVVGKLKKVKLAKRFK